MEKSQMKDSTFLISFFICWGVLVAVAIGMLVYDDRYEYDDTLRQTALAGVFSPCAWEAYPHLRYRMIEDMESQVDFQNLTRDEIIGILGLNEAFESQFGPIRYRICGSRRPRQAYLISISPYGTGKPSFFGVSSWS